MNYTVTWSIDITANSSLEAALQAEKYQRDAFYHGCFDVSDEDGNVVAIDLESHFGNDELWEIQAILAHTNVASKEP